MHIPLGVYSSMHGNLKSDRRAVAVGRPSLWTLLTHSKCVRKQRRMNSCTEPQRSGHRDFFFMLVSLCSVLSCTQSFAPEYYATTRKNNIPSWTVRPTTNKSILEKLLFDPRKTQVVVVNTRRCHNAAPLLAATVNKNNDDDDDSAKGSESSDTSDRDASRSPKDQPERPGSDLLPTTSTVLIDDGGSNLTDRFKYKVQHTNN
jgi:hypothetical protein